MVQGNLNLRFETSYLPVEESLLLLAITEAGAPILIVDKEDCIVWSNRAFSELTGLAPHIAAGMTCASLGHAEGRTNDDMLSRCCVSCPEQVDRMRLTGTRTDGTVFIAEAVVTPLNDGAGTVTHYVTVMHDVTQSALALETARRHATRDELTGVASRSHIVELLRAACRAFKSQNQLLAVLFIDLDGFKIVNDSFGHHVGDCLLTAVASRLVGVVRCSDTVARFGGDEFLVLLPTVPGREAAKQIGTHIVHQLSQPFAIGTGMHYISASVGIAFLPDHGETAELLLMRADAAMYLAKGRGGNRVAIADHCD